MTYPRTHCKRSHAMTPDNTRVLARPNGKTSFACRTCERIKALERYQKWKAWKLTRYWGALE